MKKGKQEEQSRDMLICVLSDTHCGGTTALFPNRTIWWGNDKEHQRNHTPNSKQLMIYEIFIQGAQYVKDWKKKNPNGRVILVHNGDAVEGIHHETDQIVSHVWEDHKDAHMECMRDFLKVSDWARNKGDRLYYTIGTATHTKNMEYEIANEMDSDGVYQHLELEINSRLVWLAHHGPSGGKGKNEGNPLRNFLDAIYFSCEKNKERKPDLVFTGHTHVSRYNTFVYDFHTIHGVICPSLQSKTRYGYGVAAVERNEIGIAFVEISKNGDIRTPFILKKSSETKDVIKV